VLLAFVILTLVVLALFRLFSGALGNASAAEEYSRALLIAESRLTLAASEKILREGRDAGESDDRRFHWEVVVAPFDPPLPEVPPGQPGQLAPAAQSLRAGQAVSAGRGGQPTGTGQLASLPTIRLWSISTAVSWPGPVNTRRSISLSTLRTRPVE
jgi:hypothetical protein